jgi:hypothetical protein
MAALENYSSAYTKGSTQLIIHTAQLAPDVARVVEQPTPSYEATLEVASKYEQIVKEMTDWLGETGPHQSMLEILTGRKGPTEGFTFLSGLSGAVDRNDVKKRRDLLIMVQRQVAQLQTALLRNARASTAFMGAVQRSLTE